MANENQIYRVLRVFGLPQERVVEILREARAAGCKGLRLMENNGEYAVLIQGQGDTPDKARFYCLQWEEQLSLAFGDHVFGTDEQTLPKAAAEALGRNHLQIMAGSERALEQLSAAMQGVPGAQAAFDFGRDSLHGAKAEKIAKKSPNKGRSPLGLAAWQAACVYKYCDAGLAVNSCPGYALAYDGRDAVACALPEGASDAMAANTMLDLARRMAGGLEMPAAAFRFTPSAAQREPRKGRNGSRKGGFALKALAAVASVAIVCGAGFFGWRSFKEIDHSPDSKGFGTLAYDGQVTAYLEEARAKDANVVGWLAAPEADGRLIFAAPAGETEQPYLMAWGGDTANTVVALEQGSAPDRDKLDAVIRKNGAFALYIPGETLNCKVAAVYYYDEQDERAPFDPAACQSLRDADEYMNFVVGIKSRSLYDTGVSFGDDDRFVTLLLGTNDTGGKLAVTGRVIRPGESAAWTASSFRAASAPLYTATQYAAQGMACPDIATVNSIWNNWFMERDAVVETQSEAPAAVGQIDGIDISHLTAQMEELLSGADTVMAGLTDVAGSSGATVSDVGQGAGGSVEGADVSFTEAIAAEEKQPEQKPDLENEDHSTEQAPENPENMDGVTEQGAAPGEVASGEGRTIDVTMNGVPQTMDLVECLAMIAQNELGNNQPIEAYKAQAVAAHSWILSQGSYPSVGGAAYSSTVYEAVKQVATVLITYNDKVCFTPYCASVGLGTVSCKDVWGTDRAYLQAVESPYDKQYARNWNTNGNSSGTARYSRETVRERVQEVLGIDLSAIENPNEWFTVLERNPFGYVTQMRIGNDASGSTTCSGRWFRENLLIYKSVDGRTLRSCSFDWDFNAEIDCFIFDVYGYGHGVGMSQWGAIGYAYNGWSYDQILAHYYIGTTLVSY